MKKYNIKKGYKIGYFLLSLPLSLLMGWCSFELTKETNNLLLLLLSVPMFIFASLSLFSIFFDQLVITDDFIEVKRFFRRKRFYVKDIDRFIIRNNAGYVFSNGKNIHISQDFENWREVANELKLKVKLNPEIK